MIRKIFVAILCTACVAQAHAEWFIRGSHNAWAADQMESVGNNTMLASNVTFASDGLFKFDRFGDWTENYGIGGRSGGDITIGAGTYDIRFFTDTKDWQIAAAFTGFHLRGTSNNWQEGTILQPVGGNSDLVSSCQDFSNQINPRFKIDPNGGWGGDEFPATDVLVSNGWVRVTVDSGSNSIVSVEEGLGIDCSFASSAQLHLRGTLNSWQEGTLLSTNDEGESYEICAEFGTSGLFKIDPNGAWGGDEFPATDQPASGWTYIRADAESILEISTNLPSNCESAEAAWFVSGTFNNGQPITMDNNSGNLFTATIDVTSGGTPALLKVGDGNGNSFPSSGPGLEVDFCARYSVSFNADTLTLATPTKLNDLPAESCTQQSALIKDFRDETIYFIFTDRFADGNPGNNAGNNAAAYDSSRSDFYKYFGGDIQGIIDQLDYLQAMGVTAIWTTPLIDNTDFVETDLEQAGYHGYWAKDFFAIDEHMGDWAKVDELVAAMEARGMKLVMDFAPNHSTNGFDGNFGQLWRNGVPVTLTAEDDALLPLDQQWFNHVGGINGNQNNSCDANYENCFPVNSCDGVTFCVSDWDASPQNQEKDLFGLADLNVKQQFVEDYMFEAAANWIDHGVKGFRIDAIKHFDHDFMRRLADRLNNYAIAQGYDGIYIYGEWWDAGVGSGPNNVKSQRFANSTENVDLLDFSLRYSIESTIAGDRSFQELNSAIEARSGAWNGREHYQGIFLDNHDVSRTAVVLRSNKGMNIELANRRIDLGLAMVMTLPGVPIIYYGSEQYSANFTNNGRDPYNREMMPSFNQNTPAFSIISALSELRKNSPAIQSGSYQEKWINRDILVYERKQGSDVVVVAVNRGAATTINVSDLGLADGQYTSLVGSSNVSVSGGAATLNLAQNGIIVLH